MAPAVVPQGPISRTVSGHSPEAVPCRAVRWSPARSGHQPSAEDRIEKTLDGAKHPSVCKLGTSNSCSESMLGIPDSMSESTGMGAKAEFI